MTLINSTSFADFGVLLTNTPNDFLVALWTIAGITLGLYILKWITVHKLKALAKKTKTYADDLAVEFIEHLGLPFYIIIALSIISGFLILPVIIKKTINLLLLLALFYYILKGLFKVVDYYIRKNIDKRKQKEEETSLIRILGTIIKVTIVVLAIILILSNMGINVSSLIAGVGIGGIAIAFALQNILEDLFSSFTIYLDKPFKEGDFIVLGTDMGHVKKVGIKSTRIKTLQGQELIVSNRELTQVRVNNYKKMEKRRIIFKIGVEYSTKKAKLEKIPTIVTNIIKKIELAELDRVHFKEFGDFSLNYEIAYYVNDPEYKKYMDIQQTINLELVKAFEKEKIVFAFPTQTIHVKK